MASLTMDDLLRYSAADLDPYTVAIAQQLCSTFTFSQLGYRNLGAAFDSLPGQHYAAEDFEIGFGAYHILRALLKTDTGFTLAAIIGSLAEYFDEDVTVRFLMSLAAKSDLPASQRPLEHQWTRLVNLFSGVLSTCNFGLILSDLEDKLPPVRGDLSVNGLLTAVSTMSNAVRNKGRTTALTAGPGYIWLAALATWLFDLKFTVRAMDTKVIYSSAGIDPETGARLIFSFPYPTSEISGTTQGQSSSASHRQMTGGRVSFEHFFSSCFGRTATVLREKALAAYVCSALSIFTTTLQTADTTLHSVFLSREITVSGSETSPLRTLLFAWFPEVGRQSRNFSRHEKLSNDEALSLFDESVQALTEQCACTTCQTSNGSAHQQQDRFCKVTLADFIVTMAIYISPMILAPKLFPKRNGVLSLYEECHLTRQAQTNSTPSQNFISSIATRLPVSVDVLRISALLFANVPLPSLTRDTNVMGITSTGLTIFLNGGPNPRHSDAWHVSVMVSPGWMCLFGHETRLEVFEPAYTDWDFARHWLEVKEHGSKVRQIIRWRGRVVVSSLVPRGGPEEKMAERDGWNLLA